MTDKKYEILEIYELYVGTSLRISDVRMKANAFFVSLNALILGANNYIGTTSLLLFGVGINISWLLFINSCKKLNKAKFNVIHQIEKNLEIACFKEEERLYKCT